MEDLFTDDHPSEDNLREELTNKWKDKPLEELLKAKVESDLYIKTLEKQKDELRSDWIKAQEDNKAKDNLQALIDRLNTEKTQAPITPKADENKPKQLETKDIEELIARKMQETKRSEFEAQNFNKVQAKLAERFGQNTSTVLQEQAQSLGLTKEDVNALAKKSPEAFFRVLGLDQQQDVFMSPPRSNVRNDHYAPKTVERTWNFYQDLKKKDPNKYWAPQTQLQMHRDSERLGSRFEDGDFGA